MNKWIYTAFLVFLSICISSQILTTTVTSITGGNTITCSKPSLTYSVTASTSNSFLAFWYSSQIALTGTMVSITNPDTYFVVVQDLVTNECHTDIIIIYMDTIKPLLKRDTTIALCFSPENSYTYNISPNFMAACPTCTFHWINYNGGIITPTNVANVTIFLPGSYSCVVTNTINGCSSVYVNDVICSVGLNEAGVVNADLKLFPQPANDKLNLYSNSDGVSLIKIYDPIGKLVREEEVEFNSKKGIVKTNELENGIYYLSLIQYSNSSTIIKRFVIAR